MHFSHMEFVSGIWNLRHPAKVAKTISFTVFLAHRIKKTLVFIAFLLLSSGAASQCGATTAGKSNFQTQ